MPRVFETAEFGVSRQRESELSPCSFRLPLLQFIKVQLVVKSIRSIQSVSQPSFHQLILFILLVLSI